MVTQSIFEHVEYIHERVLIYGIGNNESRDNRTENTETRQ